MRSFNDLRDLEKKAFELFSRGKKIAVVSKELKIPYSKAQKLKLKYRLLAQFKEHYGGWDEEVG